MSACCHKNDQTHTHTSCKHTISRIKGTEVRFENFELRWRRVQECVELANLRQLLEADGQRASVIAVEFSAWNRQIGGSGYPVALSWTLQLRNMEVE